MIIRELIDELLKYNGDLTVLIDDEPEGVARAIADVRIGHWDNNEWVVWLKAMKLP
jgi:hypothetical protein